jgi:hypothetical protein
MNRILLGLILILAPLSTLAQVNSGSDGSDGALNFSSLANLGYSTNIVINMTDHPTGIYQYSYVNIPTNVTVTFIPNANNTPVMWLVQSNVLINGWIVLNGQSGSGAVGGLGGPGGFRGGNTGPLPTGGEGPGGGSVNGSAYIYGGNASYGGVGGNPGGYTPPGSTYGNVFLLPLLGGSGGGGSAYYTTASGGGGGGAILIAASNAIEINGGILAQGGQAGFQGNGSGGGGSGGAVRLVSSTVTGSGRIDTSGGGSGNGTGGQGRIRFDTYQSTLAGGISGVVSSGFQPVIIPASSQLPQMMVTSVGGVAVSTSPTGVLATPDAVISAQQTNPIPVVVSCANLPLNSLITVSIKPSNGSGVSATGYNDTGTQSSSTATIPIVIPRGGGLIYATATTSN